MQALDLWHVRLIANYDLAATGYYDAWLNAAHARGIDVLVAFNQHSRKPRRLPSLRTYRRVVRSFPQALPVGAGALDLERGHASYQPTGRHPKRAAQYYRTLRSVCPRCRVVAADVLDRRGVYVWLRAFKRYLRGRPRLWGLHNYVDANRAAAPGGPPPPGSAAGCRAASG